MSLSLMSAFTWSPSDCHLSTITCMCCLVQRQQAEESVAENMVRRLGELEGQLRQQVSMHESLLRELEVARENLQQGIAMARIEAPRK